jgi:mannose-6-phosphate isomerase-like protein (cupin superfamily)
VIASDETVHMERRSLAAGKSAPLARYRKSDVALLFLSGKGELRTADRVHRFDGVRHAHIAAGATFELSNTGDAPLEYISAVCPPAEPECPSRHDAKARPGGVTLLSTSQYDRFPDSGLVRGGMFFLDPGKVASYHSHDAAAEIFVFLRSLCDAKVEGETQRFHPGEALYVPAEQKHTLANVGDERLEVWLTVTPNVTPTHTFYEEQQDGAWKRVTPRLDGRKSRPPSR